MRTLIRKAAIATTLGTLMMGGAFAQAATALPPIHKDGYVEYLSGGIGKDEATVIESASKRWPLTLEFVVKDKPRADFTADVNVVVRDAKGHTVLQATSDGPFLLAKLALGHYAVDATLAGKTLHEKVLIKHGQPAKAVFEWPASTDKSRS
jgi:hypothetical protein